MGDKAPATSALPKGDPNRGKEVFKKACAHCHTIEQGGKHIFGPNLFGMYEKKMASIEGYKYTKGHKALGGTWTEEKLDTYLASPYKMVPGTKKSYQGLKNDQERADVIAYMANCK